MTRSGAGGPSGDHFEAIGEHTETIRPDHASMTRAATSARSLPCPVPDVAGTRFPRSDASTRGPTPVPSVRRSTRCPTPVPGTWNLEPGTRHRCSNLPRPTSCPDTWDPSRSHAPYLRRQPSDKLEFPSYLILAYSLEIVRYSELTEILGNPHFSHSQGALCSSRSAISAPLWRHWPPNMSPRHVGHHVAPLPRVLGTWIGQGGIAPWHEMSPFQVMVHVRRKSELAREPSGTRSR